MVYNVVKKVSVGIFIPCYLGKRIREDTTAGPSVPLLWFLFEPTSEANATYFISHQALVSIWQYRRHELCLVACSTEQLEFSPVVPTWYSVL
jgi:hypothetical protein